MIVLDANVISELLRPAPAPTVEAWLAAQDGAEAYLTAIGEAELRCGVTLLPEGRRRTALAAALEGLLREDFAGRILPFDAAAAEAYATIAAARRATGRPVSPFDCQIAAIARLRGATVATRSTADFEGCGVALIDPWGGVTAKRPAAGATSKVFPEPAGPGPRPALSGTAAPAGGYAPGRPRSSRRRSPPRPRPSLRRSRDRPRGRGPAAPPARPRSGSGRGRLR